MLDKWSPSGQLFFPNFSDYGSFSKVCLEKLKTSVLERKKAWQRFREYCNDVTCRQAIIQSNTVHEKEIVII